MYNEDETDHSTYQGIFARQPTTSESTIWGTREIHEQPLSPNIEVSRDLYGNVTRVDQNWFNW